MLEDFLKVMPLMTASGISILLILVEAATKNARITRLFAILGFLLVFLSLPFSPSEPDFAFSNMLQSGGFFTYTATVFSIGGLLITLISDKYLEMEDAHHGEYYIILFMAVVGMMLMSAAANLTILFIGLELMSIALYVLAGIMRDDQRSNEAAIKYFLLGAFASGIFLYGIALIYGATGTLYIPQISDHLAKNGFDTLFLSGIALLMIGLLFKVAAVPFHQWSPDVYEGSPTVATAFMATGAKAAALSSMILVGISIAPILETFTAWPTAIAMIATLTMFFGNIAALIQTNLKRMFAYSSIAHAGYMLIGIATGTDSGYAGVLYYIFLYTLMNIGAFGIIILVEQKHQFSELADYEGFFSRAPLLAFLMAMFMFSLAGIPPFGGFIAKYNVFSAAVQADMTWLAVAGVIASAVSVSYYLRVVIAMFMKDTKKQKLNPDPTATATIALVAFLVLLFGIYPSLLIEYTQHALAFAMK
ncbi:proton-translocating NADH-quinone oxidoreductase, chain N [Chloroherpeton thalassium ATCC 35110]|uniref:NADH-quinone oxidoreductase subunit N 1 n=1 Tax=Chloroherpeton thalassium (strain ATCC 35110 / GB-78) TaxID=517418 RepID=NUON1_CHLT3|nr:NADH-quinone oxidoreductase subunit N [Chloroherpeton thalassium]B3QXM3.1 RecName: Full=NADH-quinone oxidoreductase subunit N 1; AltName: Full=NADH dehydrogenase I subunit N 1; AltName: Full=NDH-1 subunit N 1 [Chloroherpeton thalassium ATCC 35110]ACF14938.1 proton-translocating NADH-quinone oxidoreductase, chain N [Chloroherpeton thalassium ATCC 35110]